MGEFVIKTSGVFTTAKRVIKVPKSGVVTLVPWGDVHYGAPLHAEETFNEWLRRCADYTNPYFFGMGDYLDLASTSERGILGSGVLHDSTIATLDDLYRAKADELGDKIAFMAEEDRLLGLIEGNHFGQMSTGQTTDSYLCERFRVPWLGVSCMYRLVLEHNGSRIPITIAAHHGAGGGATTGASVNKVEKMLPEMEADIYIQGHDHKKFITTKSRLYLTQSMVVKHKTIFFVRSGSFLAAYKEGQASYIVDIARGPAELGAPAIELRVKRSKLGGGKKTMHVEMRGIL